MAHQDIQTTLVRVWQSIGGDVALLGSKQNLYHERYYISEIRLLVLVPLVYEGVRLFRFGQCEELTKVD